MEIWKDIKGFEGLYQVSNLGRIKSLGRKVKLESSIHSRNKFEIKNLSYSKKDNSFIANGRTKEGIKKRKYFSINKYGEEDAKKKAIEFIKKYKNETRIVTFKEKILRQSFDKSTGYYNVKLRKNNKSITRNVHRLVIETFIPREKNKPLTDHINGVKTDNRVLNLRWCTQKENMKYAEKRGFNFGRIRIECSNNMKFKSSREAGTWINNNLFDNTKNVESVAKFIRKVINKNKKAYGFIWKSL
jgi:hypothetical protein